MIEAAVGEPVEAPKRGRPRSIEADEAILAAALEVLTESGIAGLAMDDVAGRAGVSKATIYRRWASKEEMILDALTNAMGRFAPVDTGSLRGDLMTYTFELRERMGSPKTRDLIPHLIAASTSSPNLQAAMDEFAAIRTRPLREVLRRAVARGELAGDTDFDIAVDLLLGAMLHRRLFLGTAYSLASAERLVESVLRALDAA